jgi:hypothetical protein
MGRGKRPLTKDEQVLTDRGFKHYKGGLWIKSTKNMTTEEWLGERDFGLGGSDIGTMLGFNTFKTGVELFREKVGLNDAPKLETRHIYWGHEGEAAILHAGQYYDFSVDPKPGRWSDAWVENLYADHKLRSITPFPYLCVNIKSPWLQANVDGLENHNKRTKMATMVAEAKNTQSLVCKMYEDWVSAAYIGQGLTYSKVLQPILLAPGFKIFQKLDGNDLMARTYTISDFDWLVDDIMNESFEFYNNMVKGKEIVENATDRRQAILGLREIEPGPDDTERYNKFISQEYFQNTQFTTADMPDWSPLIDDKDQVVVDEKGDTFAIVGWRDDMVGADDNAVPVPIVVPLKSVKGMEKYAHAETLYKEKAKKYTNKAKLYSNTIKKFMSDHGVDEIKLHGGYVRWKNKFTINYKG